MSRDRRQKDENGETTVWRWVSLGALLAAFSLLAMFWGSPSFRAWLATVRVLDWAEPLKQNPLAAPMVIGVYVIAALTVFPLLLLIVYTAMVFDPVTGAVYAMAGCLAGSLTVYAVGRRLGRDTVRKLAGKRLAGLTDRLAGTGVLAVVAVRVVPVGPATIVSLVCGALGIPLWHFILGTLIGTAPGVLALTMFGDQLRRTVHSPTPAAIAGVCAMVIALGMSLWIRKAFQEDRGSRDP